MQTCTRHSGQGVELICLESACKFHLACISCVIEDHSDHPDSCLFIDDILKNNVNNQNQKLSEAVGVLRKQQDISTVVDQEYQEIQNEVLLKLDGFQDELYEYYNQLTPPDIQQKENEFLDVLKQLINCQEISQIYKQYQNKECTKQELINKVNQLINNPERQQQKQNLQGNYKLLQQQGLKLLQKDLNVNNIYFQQIQQDMQETLNEIPKVLALEKSIVFEVIQGNKSVIENGNVIVVSPLDNQAVIVSKNTFSYPNKYTLTIKIESFDTNQNQQLQVGFAHHSKSMNYNYFYRQNTSAYFGLNNHSRVNFSEQKPDGKIIGDSIRQALKEKRPVEVVLQLDIENKKFVLLFEDIKIEYSKKKCAKCGYGGEMGVEQFFSKTKKFVMFFTGCQGDIKCSVI